ncbi:polysaccharide deacetylase family protein [Bacillus sp. FJAT-52991]|uniref:Polysaccharide deacetylase family protein n=1 Tax=Bacillus kandeliae TaxID=3129297 RepID=A0ABZ2N9X3_9BACI
MIILLKLLISFCTFLISFSFMFSVPQAHSSSRSKYETSGQVIWEVNTKEKLVSLTFDDGPSSTFTPQILDLLAKHNAKATFFITGINANKYPQMLKRMVKEGHELGNHTYNHFSNKNISAKKLSNELNLTSRAIKRITGVDTTLFRPVGGTLNDTIVNTASQHNYLVVIWSWHQDPKDWRRSSAYTISNHVIKNLQNGDIILLHDAGGNRTQTVRALNTILNDLDKNGYKCVTVSELIYRSEIKKQDNRHMFPYKSKSLLNGNLQFD